MVERHKNMIRWHFTILALALVVGCAPSEQGNNAALDAKKQAAMSKVNVDEATSDQGNNAALDAKKEAAMSNKKADKANEYVPKVTREDVLRVIRREFPGNKPELILRNTRRLRL